MAAKPDKRKIYPCPITVSSEMEFSARDGEPVFRLGNAKETVIEFTLEEARELRHFLNANHRKLRPSKDWNNCPYEGHSDDCDCHGMGGDR